MTGSAARLHFLPQTKDRKNGFGILVESLEKMQILDRCPKGHNGMMLGIAVKRRYFPNGAEFEGIGIKPDIEIHPSIDDPKTNRDVVLDNALERVGSERIDEGPQRWRVVHPAKLGSWTVFEVRVLGGRNWARESCGVRPWESDAGRS